MRIRNLVVTLNDASNRRGSQQITVTARDGKDAFHQVHKFAVLLLHSLDNYQLWIYNADFGLRAVLTPEHLESAFLWSGSISVDVYQDGQKPPQLICSSGGLGAGARNSGEQQCSSKELFHQTKMRMDKTRAGIAARQQAAIATTQNGTMHHDIDNMRGHVVVGGIVNAKPEEGDSVNVNMKMCDVEDVGAGVESVDTLLQYAHTEANASNLSPPGQNTTGGSPSTIDEYAPSLVPSGRTLSTAKANDNGHYGYTMAAGRDVVRGIITPERGGVSSVAGAVKTANANKPQANAIINPEKSLAIAEPMYLRKCIVKLQRWVKRTYHNPCRHTSGREKLESMEKLFHSHCDRCNTQGLNWDLVLLHPDPDSLLQEILRKSQLLPDSALMSKGGGKTKKSDLKKAGAGADASCNMLNEYKNSNKIGRNSSSRHHSKGSRTSKSKKTGGGGKSSSRGRKSRLNKREYYPCDQQSKDTTVDRSRHNKPVAATAFAINHGTTTTTTTPAAPQATATVSKAGSSKKGSRGGGERERNSTTSLVPANMSSLLSGNYPFGAESCAQLARTASAGVVGKLGGTAALAIGTAAPTSGAMQLGNLSGGGGAQRRNSKELLPPRPSRSTTGGGVGDHPDRVAAVAGGVSAPAAVLGGSCGTAIAAPHAVPHVPTTNGEQLQLRLKKDAANDLSRDQKLLKEGQLDTTPMMVGHGSICGEDDDESSSTNGCNMSEILKRPAEECSEISSPREMADDEDSGDESDEGSSSTSEDGSEEEEDSGSSERNVRIDKNGPTRTASLRLSSSQGWKKSSSGGGCKNDLQRSATRTSSRGRNGCPLLQVEPPPRGTTSAGDRGHDHPATVVSGTTRQNRAIERQRQEQQRREREYLLEQQKQELTARIHAMEEELYMLKKCNLIYILATPLEHQPSASTNKNAFGVLRQRIRNIVLTIGDAFKKRMEQVLYVNERAVSAAGCAGNHHGAAANSAAASNTNSNGGAERGGAFMPQSCVQVAGGQLSSSSSFYHQLNNKVHGGPRSSFNSGTNLSTRTSNNLNFQTLVQIYLLISQVVEAYTHLFAGIGGSGSAIELRALSHAEDNLDKWNMVDRIYSGILSDVLEYVEGCLNRFEYLFKSSVLCKKVAELFPYTKFPLDMRQSDWKLYEKGWAGGHGAGASSGFLGSSNLLGVAGGGDKQNQNPAGSSSLGRNTGRLLPAPSGSMNSNSPVDGAGGHLDTRGTTRTSWSFRNAPNPLDPIPRSLSTLGGLSSTGYSNVNAEPLGGAGGAGLVNTGMLNGNKMHRSQQHNPKSLYQMSGYERLRQKKQWLETQAFVYLKHGRDWGRVRPLNNYVFPLSSSHSSQAGGMKMLANQEQNYSSSWSTEHQPLEGLQTQGLATVNNATSSHDPIEHHQCRRAQQSFSKYYSVRAGFTGSMIAGVNNFHSMNSTNSDHDTASVLSEKLSAFPWRKDEINAAEKQKLLWKRKCAARGGGPHLGSTRAAISSNAQGKLQGKTGAYSTTSANLEQKNCSAPASRADQQHQREQKPRGCKETDEFVILRLCPSRNFHYSFILAEKPTTLWRTVYKKAMRYYGLDYMELASFRSAIHLIPEEPIGNSNFLQQKLFHSIIVTRPTHMSTVDRVSLDLIRILEEDYALDRSTMQLTLDIPQEYLCLPHIEASRFIADLLVLPFEINTDVAAGQSQGDKVKDRDTKGNAGEAGGENSGASNTMLKTTSDRAAGGGGTAAAGGATSPKSAVNNSSSASAYVDQTAGASTTAAFAPPPPRTGRNTPPPLQNQNPSVISTTGAQVANDVTSSVGGNNSNANDVREHAKSVCEYPQFESAELLSGGTTAVHGTNAATGTTGAGRGTAHQEHAHAGAAGKNHASNSASNGKSNATSYTWNHYLQSEIIDPVAALAANATGTGESCHGNAVASVVGGNSFAGPGALFGTKNTTHAGGAGGGNSKSSPSCKHTVSSNKSSSKNHHRFYFRNSHFRRCVSIECDYQEFTAWLQFLQHLRRGNRVRQVDLMALNARITFLDVSALCEHIRHLSTKVELFRSLTFGNYVPPGLTSPGAGGGGVGSLRVAALPPIVPGSAGSNNGVLLADFEPASQIMAHQLAAAQPDAAAAGSALGGSFGGICQGMVERQLRRLEDYWLKIDEDKCFQIHLGPDAGNAAMAAFATAPGDGGGSCDGSEKPLLALEDGNAHEDGCEPPNKDAEHSADRSSYGFQTPEKKSTKHKLGRAAVGSGRALDNSRNNTSLDTTHCPLDDSGSTANSLLETSTGDVLMASSEPGYHLSPEIKEASMAHSDCVADASVALPQATPEGSPALRSPDIENAEKRVTNTGDSTSLFVAKPDCHRVTDFVSHRVEPLTTAACGGGGAAAAGKGIAIGTRRRQHGSLAASTEEKGPVGAPGSSADAEVHPLPTPHPTGAGVAAPNGPKETEPAAPAANTEAAAPRDTSADSSTSSFSSTLQQLLSWNTYTTTKWGSATTNVLKNVFGGGVDLDLHDAQHDNSTRSPSSASSDHGTSGDEVVHFESGSAGVVGNSDAKPEHPPPPPRSGCRVMNAPTRINRQALGGHHPNTCDPVHSGKTETTFKSTLKEEKEKEDRITHYRGTPNVITPAYVLGTTGSSTTNAIKNVADTWLIQKVVSTASTTGGSLFIPGAGAETVPLKHYTFKMDPMRGGLHVIRQHPGSSVTSASTPGRDYIVAPTSLTMSLGVSVGVQTALGLVRNLWTAKEDTKAEDIGRELVKDAGKGACVGTSYWSVLQLINAAQGSSVVQKFIFIAKKRVYLSHDRTGTS
eukprot:g5369.t1